MELLAWNVAYSANISRIIEVYLIPGRPRPKSGMWESSQPNPYSVFPFQLVLSSRYLVDSAVEFCLLPIDFGLITPGLAVVPASLLAEVLLFAGFYRNHFALRKSLSCMKLSLSLLSPEVVGVLCPCLCPYLLAGSCCVFSLCRSNAVCSL